MVPIQAIFHDHFGLVVPFCQCLDLQTTHLVIAQFRIHRLVVMARLRAVEEQP